MRIEHDRSYDDLDIKLLMGNLWINILYIRFIAPSADWTVGTHSHNSYELHFVPYGKGMLRLNQETFEIEPGTFYLTGPGIFHAQKSDEHDPMAECCINFEFKVLKRARVDYRHFPEDEVMTFIETLSNTRYWFGKDDHNSVSLFEQIINELDRHLLGYYFKIQSLISQIIINAVRCYVHSKKADYSLPVKVMDDKRGVIIESFFLEEYSKEVSSSDLARDIGVSRRHMNRILRKQYGTNFKSKLTNTRLETAKDYLMNTSLSVDKISEQVGFSSSSYFCKVFKEKIGMTPTQYRKKAGKSSHHVIYS